MYEIFNFDNVKNLSNREMKALIPIFRNNLTVLELELSDRDGRTDYFSEPQAEKPAKLKKGKKHEVKAKKAGRKKKDAISIDEI